MIAKISNANNNRSREVREQLLKTFQKPVKACEREKIIITPDPAKAFPFGVGPDETGKEYKLYFFDSGGKYTV